MPKTLTNTWTMPAARRALFVLTFLTAACCAQTAANSSWAVLEAGLEQRAAPRGSGRSGFSASSQTILIPLNSPRRL